MSDYCSGKAFSSVTWRGTEWSISLFFEAQLLMVESFVLVSTKLPQWKEFWQRLQGPISTRCLKSHFD
jgi:hypothetical protein